MRRLRGTLRGTDPSADGGNGTLRVESTIDRTGWDFQFAYSSLQNYIKLGNACIACPLSAENLLHSALEEYANGVAVLSFVILEFGQVGNADGAPAGRTADDAFLSKFTQDADGGFRGCAGIICQLFPF